MGDIPHNLYKRIDDVALSHLLIIIELFRTTLNTIKIVYSSEGITPKNKENQDNTSHHF